MIGAKRLDKLSVRDVKIRLNQVRTTCQCCAQGKDAARTMPRCCAAGRCCKQFPSDWTSHQASRVLRSAQRGGSRRAGRPQRRESGASDHTANAAPDVLER
jgi:hypothetical protein